MIDFFGFMRSEKKKIYPVLLSGGSGTRLWPLSRENYPKQLLRLLYSDDYSMLQLTVQRVQNPDLYHPPIIICNETHRFAIAEQLSNIGVDPLGMVLEPVGRNTAASIMLAALKISEIDKDGIMLVLPSDHYIGDVEAFQESVNRGMIGALNEKIMIFGIPPTSPHTGYGYLQMGAEGSGKYEGLYPITAFREKPDLETAKSLIADPQFFWNSGIVLSSVDRILTDMKKYEPEIYVGCKNAFAKKQKDPDFTRLSKEIFEKVPAWSIDHALLERSPHVLAVHADMDWNDVGSWKCLWEARTKDMNGNVTVGEVFLHEVEDCLIHTEEQMMAGIGLKDLIIVALRDVIMVADKSQADEIQNCVKMLKKSGRSEAVQHHRVYKPWGNYEQINKGNRFQVKFVMLKPGAVLEMQTHLHRSEHWVVVSGTARVNCQDKTYFLSENESTYIPLGSLHSLENPGMVPLKMIQVLSGEYLGEDDVVTKEDQDADPHFSLIHQKKQA